MGKSARLKKERSQARKQAGIKKWDRNVRVGSLDEVADEIEKFLRAQTQKVRHRIKVELSSPEHLIKLGKKSKGFKSNTEEEREMLNKGVSCTDCKATKGCCYLAVSALLFEVFPIVRRLRDSGVDSPAFRQRLREIGERMENTTEEDWFDQKEPCIFLNQEERCSIYSVRPFSCRTHVVFTPPENCDPDNEVKGTLQFDTDPEFGAAMFWNIGLCTTFFDLPDPATTGNIYGGAFPLVLLKVLEALDHDDWREALRNTEWPNVKNPPLMS